MPPVSPLTTERVTALCYVSSIYRLCCRGAGVSDYEQRYKEAVSLSHVSNATTLLGLQCLVGVEATGMYWSVVIFTESSFEEIACTTETGCSAQDAESGSAIVC